MHATKLVAVAANDVDAQSLGSITMWSHSGDTSMVKLRDAWLARGLSEDLLPSLPTPVAALSLAVRDVCVGEGKHFPRSLPSGGWVIVDESAEQVGLRWQTDATVTLDAVGLPVVEPAGHDVSDGLMVAFKRRISSLTTATFGGWLSAIVVRECHAQSVRPNGGAYFVPRDSMTLWRSMVDAIHESTGHRVTLIPAMKCDDAVESVLAHLREEAEAELAKINEDITKGELGPRGLRTRSRQASAMADKLERYEGLLDRSLEGLRGALGTAEATAVHAAIMLEG